MKTLVVVIFAARWDPKFSEVEILIVDLIPGRLSS